MATLAGEFTESFFQGRVESLEYQVNSPFLVFEIIMENSSSKKT